MISSVIAASEASGPRFSIGGSVSSERKSLKPKSA